MKIKTTTVRIQSTFGTNINAKFLDAEYMNDQYPSTFSIHSELIRKNIPRKMWVKCGIHYENGVNENAWLEVIEVNKDNSGKVMYKARFDEFNLSRVGSGAIAHDIEPKHILDLDFDRFKKLFTH